MLATKVFSVSQIRQAEITTMQREPIRSIDLMERAAIACTGWIRNRPYKPLVFHVFCGLGNNGGDGLAIARLLLNDGYTVRTHVVRYSDKYSSEFLENEVALSKIPGCEMNYIVSEEQIPTLNCNEVVIDALIGIGLSNPLSGLLSKVIEKINLSKATVLSIDMASGLFADRFSHPESSIVKPDYTLSFQFPKPAFFFAMNEEFVGEFVVLDIGLDQDYLDSEPAKNYYLSEADVKAVVKPRKKFSHKGTFGHSLIAAGAEGKIGAALLCARAALKSGTGLLSVQVPGCGYLPLQTALPEAMVIVDENTRIITQNTSIDHFAAIGIGPGIGTAPETTRLLETILKGSVRPLVLDADALNIISQSPDLIRYIPKHSILTPHVREFERLTQVAVNDFHRNQLQIEFSQVNQLYVVLKGAHTCISTPDGHCYFNSSGNPGMAKGGSGDVLTGIITSLLAQSYHPLESANIGVFVHGLAGDFAAAAKGETSMTASDIIDYLPEAFMRLHRP